ncbi:hypothetical protein CGCFRS4_v002519 [Colletotrichum fructicola]|nr:hypothetical protein CGCFRS4_v002519 [Colletotrichum fructicola]
MGNTSLEIEDKVHKEVSSILYVLCTSLSSQGTRRVCCIPVSW